MSTDTERDPAKFDPVGKWDYSKIEQPARYGEDDVTYEKGMRFLEGCDVIEDWGCGTAYAEKFTPEGSMYRGLDGSPSDFCDEVVDLRIYRSQAEGIFMRHILEHNLGWEKILGNALASFTKKFVLMIFTPWRPETGVCYWDNLGVVDICFKREDIVSKFEGFKYTTEELVTKTACGVENVFYFER